MRKAATANYLRAAGKQQERYNRQFQKVCSYSKGDTVGVHIHYIDRTNTDAKMLHCKVAEVKPKGTYRLFCEHGLLKGVFAGCDLVDLTSSSFPAQNAIDSHCDALEEVTLIQASRMTNKWTTPQRSTVCTCQGSCVTSHCRCKKNGPKCSTKCHK